MASLPHTLDPVTNQFRLHIIPDQMEILDTDIVSFCALSPSIFELAFTLADHGHIYLGQVVTLSAYTITDLANGKKELTQQLRKLIQCADLDFDMKLNSWTPPGNDTDEDID